jgi:hypothetical protein
MRRIALLATVVVAVAAVAAGAVPAAQQVTTANDGVVHSDFNGDGYADLAIGAPSEGVGGAARAGAVHVLYGGPNGPSATNSQLFTQASPGVSGAPETGDFFGHALAAGDFDGDVYADLAIGVPREDISDKEDAGLVEILSGSPQGLTATGENFSFASATGEARCECRFGEALAAGDFDDDGKADLAVGAPERRTGVIERLIGGRLRLESGAVVLLDGSGDGLRESANPLLKPPDDGGNLITDAYIQIWDMREVGAALAAGDHDGDGDDDLAVAMPGARVTYGGYLNPVYFVDREAGLVALYNGSGAGVRSDQRVRFLWQEDFPASSVKDGDRFGSELAFGDFDGNGREELAIGAHMTNIGDAVAAGKVYVLDSARNETRWTQGPLADASPEKDDLFGFALATGDFNGDGRDELVVAAPFENFGGKTNAGMVHVLRGTSTGLSATGAQIFHQNKPNVAGGAEDKDVFGFALGVGNYGGNAQGQAVRADLAIGVYGERVDGKDGAGMVHVLFGSSTGVTASGSQYWTQDSPGVADQVGIGDRFGGALP